MEDNEFEDVLVISYTDRGSSILPQSTAERIMKNIRLEVTQKITRISYQVVSTSKGLGKHARFFQSSKTPRNTDQPASFPNEHFLPTLQSVFSRMADDPCLMKEIIPLDRPRALNYFDTKTFDACVDGGKQLTLMILGQSMLFFNKASKLVGNLKFVAGQYIKMPCLIPFTYCWKHTPGDTDGPPTLCFIHYDNAAHAFRTFGIWFKLDLKVDASSLASPAASYMLKSLMTSNSVWLSSNPSHRFVLLEKNKEIVTVNEEFQLVVVKLGGGKTKVLEEGPLADFQYLVSAPKDKDDGLITLTENGFLRSSDGIRRLKIVSVSEVPMFLSMKRLSSSSVLCVEHEDKNKRYWLTLVAVKKNEFVIESGIAVGDKISWPDKVGICVLPPKLRSLLFLCSTSYQTTILGVDSQTKSLAAYHVLTQKIVSAPNIVFVNGSAFCWGDYTSDLFKINLSIV